AGQGAEAVGRDRHDGVAGGAQLLAYDAKGADDAVHLRDPSIADQRDLHGRALVALAGLTGVLWSCARLPDPVGPGVAGDSPIGGLGVGPGLGEPRLRVQRVEGAQLDPVNDLEPAVPVLDEGGAAFDPVAVVTVDNVTDRANLGLVDVAADDAVEAAAPRLVSHRRGVVADIFDGVLDLALEVGRKGPV